MSVEQDVRSVPSEAKDAPRHRFSGAPSKEGRRVSTAAAVLLIAVAVMIYGGYDKNWSWTGVDASKTLWDWLQMLLLPIAFGTLPLAMRRRRVMRRKTKIGLSIALAAFVVLVLCGYLVPWAWTGFGDNTLWDWFELVLLPVTIASVRFLAAERRICARHRIVAGVLIVVMVTLVACGYLLRWNWTGFDGNTLFDWIKLLLLPVLFPTVIVPTVANWLTREQKKADEETEAAEAADAVISSGRGPNSSVINPMSSR